MTISIKRGDVASLGGGKSGTTPWSIQLGLGWSVPKSPSLSPGSILAGLWHFCKHFDVMTESDLGVYTVLINDSNRDKVEILTPFGGLYNGNGSVQQVRHDRRKRTDADDVVTVNVDLLRVPANVNQIVFTIGSLGNDDGSRYDFSRIDNAFCRIGEKGTAEIARLVVPTLGEHNLIVMTKLSRASSTEWIVTTVGERSTCLTVRDIGRAARRHV